MRMFFPLRHLLRRRRLLIIIIIVGIMFLFYQLLSVGQLGKELSKRRIRSKLQTNFRDYEKADGIMQVKFDEDEGELDKNKILEQKGHQVKSPDFHQEIESPLRYGFHNKTQGVLGVLPQNQKFYAPSNSETFRCISSGKEILFSQINDDFCDCDDFSDEPSTSACNDGRFFCNHQPDKLGNTLYIKSYMVNDGVCDCCDGSDEWKQSSAPGHSLISGI